MAGNARDGIAINSGSQVRQCVVSGNGRVGILTSNDVEVDDCVSGSNGSHGIQVGTDSNVRRCLVSGNTGSGITVENILVTSSGNRIDSKHTTGGQHGFNITGSDNLIVRNSARSSNPANNLIAAGNHSAAIVTSPGVGFASSSPWVNFSFQPC